MAKYKSDFLNVLDERGFIHQCSDFAGLDALAVKGDVIAYVGYDCTAPSLHIGHLYTNHLDAARLQRTREPRPLPKIRLNPAVTSLFDFTYEDFEVVGYEPHPHIPGKVAV